VRPGVSGLVSDRKELVLCAGSGPDVLVNEPCGLGDPLRARPGRAPAGLPRQSRR